MGAFKRASDARITGGSRLILRKLDEKSNSEGNEGIARQQL
jgi:hypothetical protein